MKNILIVDDELEMRELLYDILSRKGYEVSTAPSGEEALSLMQKERPALIILDIKMPGMDGIQTLKKIRGFDEKVEVVMLTSVATDELEKEAREIGVSDFLRKGLGVELFMKMVAKLLVKKEAGPAAEGEQRGKILVVDDEPEVCSLLSDFLTKKGYQVIVANSGQEAISLVREEKPQLVLLDIRMPGMDGMFTLKRVKEIDEEIAVIMISAAQDMELAKQALELGAYDYIAKPFNFEYLETSVWSKIQMMI